MGNSCLIIIVKTTGYFYGIIHSINALIHSILYMFMANGHGCDSTMIENGMIFPSITICRFTTANLRYPAKKNTPQLVNVDNPIPKD